MTEDYVCCLPVSREDTRGEAMAVAAWRHAVESEGHRPAGDPVVTFHDAAPYLTLPDGTPVVAIRVPDGQHIARAVGPVARDA
jgi:hypothetical protein